MMQITLVARQVARDASSVKVTGMDILDVLNISLWNVVDQIVHG